MSSSAALKSLAYLTGRPAWTGGPDAAISQTACQKDFFRNGALEVGYDTVSHVTQTLAYPLAVAKRASAQTIVPPPEKRDYLTMGGRTTRLKVDLHHTDSLRVTVSVRRINGSGSTTSLLFI